MSYKFPFFCLCCLALLNLNIGLLAQTPKNRVEALRTFKACKQPTRPATLDCSEEFVANVIDLYNRGDYSLLKPLLDAGLSSDGALSEELGDFYSNVLSRNPRRFLAAVRSHPVKQEAHLCWMAGVTDGGGMETQMLRNVRRSLRVISSRRDDILSSVARTCLANVNRANASSGR
jgi:hypothetical protein